VSVAPQWDPEVLARLGQLHLRARGLVSSISHGNHKSLRISRNVEFADYKVYTPGDDLRDLDWKVYSRNDRMVVRRQQSEDELSVVFILDATADMSTGEAGKRPALTGSKLGAAITMIATMAYYLQHRGEPIGLAVLGGEGVTQPWIPPRRGANHLAQIFGTLAALKPAGSDVLAEGFSQIGRRIPRRAAVVVVSDLMEEPESWGPALSAMLRRQSDLRIAHIYDRKEWEMDFSASARFFSPEGGTPMPIDPDTVREAFSEVVTDYLAEVRQWLGRSRAVHVLVPTDDPLELPIGRLLAGVMSRGA
jgi:uncharacterized protein (DUF58 family)